MCLFEIKVHCAVQNILQIWNPILFCSLKTDKNYHCNVECYARLKTKVSKLWSESGQPSAPDLCYTYQESTPPRTLKLSVLFASYSSQPMSTRPRWWVFFNPTISQVFPDALSVRMLDDEFQHFIFHFYRSTFSDRSIGEFEYLS